MNEEKQPISPEQQYQLWTEELLRLQNIDWDRGDAPDSEYIGYRIKLLKSDILAYEETRAIIKSANVTEGMDDGEYWNAIALANDEWNGDLW